RLNLTPADYLRRLDDAKQRLSYLKEVDVALNVSYEMLAEEQRRLWRALSIFPQTFDGKAVAEVWDTERDAAQEALGNLMKWSLVDFSAETRRYRLHDLARLFAEAKLSDAGDEETNVAQSRFARHYVTVIETINNEPIPHRFSLLEMEWDNIRAGQAW